MNKSEIKKILKKYHKEYKNFCSVEPDSNKQDAVIANCMEEFGVDIYSDIGDDIFADTYNYVFGFEDTKEDLDALVGYIKEDLDIANERISQLTDLYNSEPEDLTSEELQELIEAGVIEELQIGC